MSVSIPIHLQFNDEEKNRVATLFKEGKTQAQIGTILNKPRRTIGKLLKYLKLSRTTKEAAELVVKSPLDEPHIIENIREWRSNYTLSEIAKRLGSSISAIDRICKKYSIELPQNYDLLQSKRIKNAWTNEKKLLASIDSIKRVTPDLRRRLSDSSKKLWQNGRYRNIQSEHRSKQSWAISSLQTHLYEMLDDLGVGYFREYDDRPNDPETVIGPYNFDCSIPRVGKPTLLIECHGDYWHSLGKAILKDEQKESYIVNNFAGQYELKCLWEHEFKCRDKVLESLKYWLGIAKLELIKFNFSDVSISVIDVKTANKLLEKYHYLNGCGRGGLIYGVYLADKLIAVCAFSSLIRQNLPYDKKTTRELSRFCIHPKYQARNFGSWIISKCMKLLPSNISTVISYCDTTFNHDGALYKASNFVFDGSVRPDYWYVNADKWVMHKKTLYQHAVKMSMSENDYALKHNYKRVYGTEKLRFMYKR